MTWTYGRGRAVGAMCQCTCRCEGSPLVELWWVRGLWVPYRFPPQAVPDPLPVCIPEVQELRITAGSPGSRQPVTRLQCHSSPDSTALTYTIVGGEERPSHGANQPSPWCDTEQTLSSR